MTPPADLNLSVAEPAVLAGCWKLAGGRAVTLSPRRPGVLRIAHGQVWATVDGPHPGHGNERGDQFLSSGQTLTLRAGQRVVIEPWIGARARAGGAEVSVSSEPAAWFSWDELPAGAEMAGASAARVSRWELAVAQPLADLRLALVIGGDAVIRLVLGLAGWAFGRSLSVRAASALPRASRAHGLIKAGDSIALSGALQ